MADPDLVERSLQYAQKRGLELDFDVPLGFGMDGHVWMSDSATAVKAFRYQRNYMQGDDVLWIVEMEIVTPPYLLDFGKVALDARPDYSPEV